MRVESVLELIGDTPLVGIPESPEPGVVHLLSGAGLLATEGAFPLDDMGDTLRVSLADDQYSVFGEALVRGSLEDCGGNSAVGGKVGLNVKW